MGANQAPIPYLVESLRIINFSNLWTYLAGMTTSISCESSWKLICRSVKQFLIGVYSFSCAYDMRREQKRYSSRNLSIIALFNWSMPRFSFDSASQGTGSLPRRKWLGASGDWACSQNRQKHHPRHASGIRMAGCRDTAPIAPRPAYV